MFDIIVNPISGKGKSLAALKTVETILTGKSLPYVVHRTDHAGHATEIVKELINKQDHTYLIAMGGDGSFNEVINGITDFDKITVGFIPCGTGNDYIKATGVPSDVSQALDLIIKGKEGFTDYLQVNDIKALNCAGTGMDVDVLLKYASMKHFKGKIKYYVSLISVLLHLKFHKMRITVDGKVLDRSVFLIVAANGIYIGGGMPISPRSITNDGKLNLVIVNEIKPSKVFGLLLKFLNGGKHIDEPCTESFLVDEVKIEIMDDSMIQLDGEVRDCKVLNCKIVHDALRTYVD